LVRSADACIFVGGGIGTLNEFTIAFDELESSCAIGVLTESGGLSDVMAEIVAAVGRPPEALLVFESEPEALLERIFRHIGGI
jgi:predicted Rossmann-fold nucleotide-binding protein